MMMYKLARFFREGKGLLLINLVAVASVGWGISLWVNQLTYAKKSATVPAYTPPTPRKAQNIQMNADYSVITKKNIFNPSTPSTLAGPASGEVVPCTLPLKLVGTILSDNKSQSMAIIETQDKEKLQGLYKIQEQVGGATIIRIESFEVILNNNGRLESLATDFGKLGGDADAGKKGAPGVQTSGHVIMDKSYFDNQKKNTSDLMTQVRALPNMGANGAINGFQINEIGKDSLYDRVGLKNMDVIQRVNGQSLTSVESGLDLFNALKNDTHFTLDIVRNKQNQTIKVDVQ
jgi:general secretion pathway protein C